MIKNLFIIEFGLNKCKGKFDLYFIESTIKLPQYQQFKYTHLINEHLLEELSLQCHK